MEGRDITTSFPSANFLCNFTIFNLTSTIAETCETKAVTSLLLILSVTSSPFRKIVCMPSLFFISIFIVSDIFIILSFSFLPLL